MRTLTIVCAALLLTGCDKIDFNHPEAVAACEQFIKAKLRSPSSYVRVSAIEGLIPANIGQIETDGADHATVTIEYDAANAYGTPVRGTETCRFSLSDGKVDTDGIENPANAKLRAISVQLDPPNDPVESLMPCCLPKND